MELEIRAGAQSPTDAGSGTRMNFVSSQTQSTDHGSLPTLTVLTTLLAEESMTLT